MTASEGARCANCTKKRHEHPSHVLIFVPSGQRSMSADPNGNPIFFLSGHEEWVDCPSYVPPKEEP